MIHKKYTLVTILHNGEKDTESVLTKTFSDLTDAKKELHGNMNTYIRYGQLDYVTCVVLNANGGTEISDHWEEPYVAPEPEPTPENTEE